MEYAVNSESEQRALTLCVAEELLSGMRYSVPAATAREIADDLAQQTPYGAPFPWMKNPCSIFHEKKKLQLDDTAQLGDELQFTMRWYVVVHLP